MYLCCESFMDCAEWLTISVVNLVLQVYSDERFGWAEVCVCVCVCVCACVCVCVCVNIFLFHCSWSATYRFKCQFYYE